MTLETWSLTSFHEIQWKHHYLMQIFKQKEKIFLYQKHVKYKIVLGNVEVYNLKYIQGVRY